ncbi:hypothetical protein [Kribbella flavida]|uniref:hypothetical protein n=1 Tax=Kribbella flavida TaxID=182640 RepID=UPI0011D21D0D|nr:hypothetical protein [Kribbella flavida]
MSAADKQLLRTLLGPTSLCVPADGLRVECGRVYAATSKVVGTVEAALKGMPATKPYQDAASNLRLFQKTYRTMRTLGCFAAKKPKEAELCTSLANVARLTLLIAV